MSKTDKSSQISFNLEGAFLGFIYQEDQCKYLKIATDKGELILQLSKNLRQNISLKLEPNQIIQVFGKSKLKRKQKQANLKVVQIKPKTEANSVSFAPLSKQVKLLICQKSGCQKKGGKKQHQAISASLEAKGLSQSVMIEETGCLGKCSLAPNVMLMPSKKRLSGMKSDEIADLLKNITQNN